VSLNIASARLDISCLTSVPPLFLFFCDMTEKGFESPACLFGDLSELVEELELLSSVVSMKSRLVRA